MSTSRPSREHGRDRINVKVVALGAVSLEGIKTDARRPDATRQNDERLAKMIGAHPIARRLGRLSRPDDISGLVAFLASDRAVYVPGQRIGVSGGFAMI